MGQVFCFASISEELLFPTMKIRFLSNYKGKRHTLHVKYLTCKENAFALNAFFDNLLAICSRKVR